jgi:YVTN family beta-propeller protein
LFARLVIALTFTLSLTTGYALAANENVTGRWSSVTTLPLVPSSGAVLPNGKVLLWAADGEFSFGSGYVANTVLVDPTSLSQQRLTSNVGHNMFCTGTTNLPDGRILVNGGTQSTATSIFDPTNNSFTLAQNMNVARGYNANTILPDGSVFTLGGSWSVSATTDKIGEVWTSSGGWQSRTGISSLPMQNPAQAGNWPQDSHYWLIPSGNGKVLYAGPAPDMKWINTNGTGSVRDAGRRGNDVQSILGNTVMYDTGKVFKAGGGETNANTTPNSNAYVIDVTTGAAITQPVGNMIYPRGFQNSVVLPDGKIVIIGGQSYLQAFADSDSVMASEIWDPATSKFTVAAPISVPRNYHSIAMLLPDGRVLSAGGGLCACSADHPDYQIFTPPNLLDAGGNLLPRPAITAAPSQFAYGGTAQVTTDRAVSSFALIRVSSTTHTVNNDQRRIALKFTQAGTNQYNINIPTNSGYLLPGYWMLFAVDAAGVPSVSKIVQVQPNSIARMVSPDPISSRVGISIGVQPELYKTASTVTYGGMGLPPGITVNPTTGYVSGAPTAAGTFTGQLTATDGIRTVSTDLAIFVDQPAAGTGLLGEYFSTSNLSGATTMLRTEAVDFAYTTSGPGGGVPGVFSARWSGTIMAMRSGPTAFQTLSDDGVRVWVDGKLLIDNWTAHAPTTDAGTIDLVSGRSYAIEISYNNTGGPGDIHLRWQRPGDSAFSAVPISQLFPAVAVTSANVAAGKTATQSTTYAAGYGAQNAVDSSTNNGLVSHTLTNANEWWQADLGAAHRIDRIRLWNRLDCCSERLRNFYVFVSDTDLTGRSYAAILADASVKRRFVGASTIPSNIDVPGGITGRFVRVQLDGAQYLNLTEVEVRGVINNNPPAIATPPNQISTIGKVVSLAVSASDPDGNALRYAATGLPGGLSINTTTGLISGTITAAGNFSPRVTVTDTGGLSASAAFSWSVAYAVPFVQSLPVAPQIVNTNVVYQPVIGNSTSVSYSWSFGDGSAATALSPQPSASHVFTTAGIYTVTLSMQTGSGNLYAYRFDQAVGTQPLAGGGGAASSSSSAVEQRTSGSPRLWIANPDNDSVAVIDLGTNARVAEIPVGKNPFAVAMNPNGTVWVTNRRGDSISVIDPASLAVTKQIWQQNVARPSGLVFAGPNNQAFVSFESWRTLALEDGTSGAITKWAAAGDTPRHLATNAARTRVYSSLFITLPLPGESTANVATVDAAGAPVGGEVREFDSAGTLLRKFVLQHSNRADTEVSGRGIPNYLGAPAVSPDGGSLWVPSKQDNIKRGVLRDGQQLNFQNTVRAIVSRIDLATGLEDLSSRIDVDNSGIVSAIAFHPSGAYLFAALQSSREVAVLDPGLKRELFRFKVGRAPNSLALSPDGKTLLVGNMMDRTVTIVDLTPMLATGQKAVTIKATVSTIATEKLPAQVLLGKQLFYDASDTRLARDGYLSCAVCHDSAAGDGRVWDLTGFGEGLRNTISLDGHGGMAQGFLHWTANFDEVQDFEGQIRSLAGGTGLMKDADYFSGTRAQPLGTPKAGLSADLDALAAYVGSLSGQVRSPYRAANGTFSNEAAAGQIVFNNLGCGACHGGTQFTISADASQLKNIGTITATSGKRLGAALTALDVPTLRAIWSTAPYLHDGSAPNLAWAIYRHSGVARPANDADFNNLARYLRELE